MEAPEAEDHDGVSFKVLEIGDVGGNRSGDEIAGREITMTTSKKSTAVIAGAGPAGITAACELLKHTDIVPLVFEAARDIGGISKTVKYKGNGIDIGGHRFYSKSERVVRWWLDVLPLQGAPASDDIALGRTPHLSPGFPSSQDAANPDNADPGKTNPDKTDPEKTDAVMLIRNRISRIFYLRKFFDYPISVGLKTFSNIGVPRSFKIAASYFKAVINPIKEEKSLEDFFINRFGKELYLTFFKDYTEKVWGIPCNSIDPAWGAQRVKGLSITKALLHAARGLLFGKDASLGQEKTETSLIERFMYPKYGPGQLWEEAAKRAENAGAKIFLNSRVTGIRLSAPNIPNPDGSDPKVAAPKVVSPKVAAPKVVSVDVLDTKSGKTSTIEADYFFSTMPVKELIEGIYPAPPKDVLEVARGLAYRDFITVGLLLKKLKIKNTTKIKTVNDIIPDNWIYIQERDVKIGRLQVFNNWSPYMVKDPGNSWLGLEYFCAEGDELWLMPDDALAEFASSELEKIGIIAAADVLDHVVIRVPKTYPAYFGSYDRFDVVRKYTDSIENLFLIGRNGMHRYNNQDHSMLTAMAAVENIAGGVKTKENIWSINTESEYLEKKK
jgi:protoporphyrinogen oxidase